MADNELKEEKKLYKKFLDDKDHLIEDLEIELKKPNIFNILRIGRKEIRHSNFLGWLLDPNGSHGLGNKFLVRVLRDLSLENDKLNIFDVSNFNFNNVDVYREYSITYKDDKNKDKKGFIDILIIFRDDNFVICIENKIDTTDSDGQLTKYREYVEKTFTDGYKNILVYLTPYKDDPNNPEEKQWHNYSYRDGIIEHLKHIEKTVTDLLVKTYISDYLTTLKSEIMGTQDKAQELANLIYENHKDIIDFVNANRNANKEYQNYWENNNTFVLDFVKKLIEFIEEMNKTNEYKYEYEYMEKHIKIKQKNETQKKFAAIYYIWKGAGKNCNMEFSFSANEEEDRIRDSVKEMVDKYNSTNVKCSNATYFKILGVNNLCKEKLQEIHKLRFDIK